MPMTECPQHGLNGASIVCLHLAEARDQGIAREVFVAADRWGYIYYLCRECFVLVKPAASPPGEPAQDAFLFDDHGGLVIDRETYCLPCWGCFHDWFQATSTGDLLARVREARALVSGLCPEHGMNPASAVCLHVAEAIDQKIARDVFMVVDRVAAVCYLCRECLALVKLAASQAGKPTQAAFEFDEHGALSVDRESVSEVCGFCLGDWSQATGSGDLPQLRKARTLVGLSAPTATAGRPAEPAQNRPPPKQQVEGWRV